MSSNIDELQRALSSDNLTTQSRALNGLAGLITEYVNDIEKAQHLVDSVHTKHRQLRSLKRSDDSESAAAAEEIRAELRKAKELESDLRRRKDLINGLKKDIQAINSALMKLH